jgi:hypothetical protein
MTSRTPPPLETEFAGDVSTVTRAWCPDCKAWTLLTGETVLITRTGVVPVGSWAWCETCHMAEEAPPRV